MRLILEKGDLTWLQKNGFLGQEQVGIVWEQLSQRCNRMQDDSSWTYTTNTRNELELPWVQGLLLGEPKTSDICIVFSLKNGEALARSLQNRIKQKKKKVILASQNGKFDPKESEIQIASSTALVVLLTEDCLKQVEVVFALVVAKFYYQHPSLVILVHDAESCFFPGYDEQPESVKDFFSEKAVTYLNCYPEEGVTEIVEKFDNEAHVLENITNNFRERPTDALHQFLVKNENRKSFPIKELRQRMKPYMTTEQLDEFEAMADKNKDGTLDPEELQQVLPRLKQTVEGAEEEQDESSEEPEMEDLVTRLFLSHKRSTGQGIAGRLYEGLKSSYKVFIDSEAKFKIHNLKLIVQSTDVFVFILSYGIFLSKWCLEELKSAVENKKKVIVVRELLFKYPDVLPEEWLEVEPVLKNSRELVWLAEYNSACVRALKNFIGSADERYRPAAQYFSSREGKPVLAAILQKFQSDKILDLNRTIPVPSHIEVDAILDFVLESVPAEEITIVHISCNAENNEGSNDAILPSIFSRLPNVHELDLAGCGALVTSAVVKEICTRYPFLKKLDLDQCIHLTSEAMKSIKELDHLTFLNLDKIKELKDGAVEILSTGCPSLEVLKLGFADLTHKSFEYLPALKNLKEVDFPYTLKNHEDADAKKFVIDHPEIKINMEPVLFDCQDHRGDWYPATVKEYQATHMLVHFYGRAEDLEETILKSQIETRIAQFKSHSDEYGYQDVYHATEECLLCEPMHALLEHDKFSNSANKHFINDWYFKEQEGIDHLQPFLEDAAKGFIDASSYALPTGIKAATFMNAIFEKYPEEYIKHMYLDKATPQHYADFLKTVPHLKMLSVRRNRTTLDQFKNVCEVIPTQLEYLDWGGELDDEFAEVLASKVPLLTTLHLCVDTEITDKGILAFFGENCKYQTLTIRNARKMTVEAFEKIAANCKDVTDLNLTLNEELASHKNEVTDILIKNFPSLKRLMIDLPFVNSPKFEEFKKARPEVEIADFASMYVRDVSNYYNQWYPGIQISEKKFPKESLTFHFYGTGNTLEYNLSDNDDKNKIKPFGTEASNYGEQDYHATTNCYECSLIHDLCEKVLFAGEPNKAFKNDWFFEQEEGKTLLQNFVPYGPLNRIIFGVELPDGIEEWAVVKALVKQLDLEQTYTLNFLKNVKDIEKLLEQPLPISGLEFGMGRNITDVIPLLEKLPKLTRLDLQHCTNYDADVFKKFNAPNLEYLDLAAVGGITDDVVEGIAKSTKLTYLSLAGTSLTDKGIEVLAPSWSNLTSLNLRLLPITQPTIELICKHCPKLESLNLILCAKLPPSACKLIQESLPNLKELKVPFHWTESAELAELKSARPDIEYFEKTEFVDAYYGTDTCWYPAVVVHETTKYYQVHFYCVESNWNGWLPIKSAGIEPLFSKQDEYGKQQPAHLDSDCPYCSLLHPQCKDLMFGNSKNVLFINDWFLDSVEGKHFISNLTDAARDTGKLDLNVALPAGLRFDIVAQAAIEGVSAESLTQIVFPEPVAADKLEAMISDKPNLHTLELHGAFTDEHAAVTAKCEGLIHLTLFWSEITSVGLQTLAEKLKNLGTLNIKLCKKITDKGLEAILLANKKIEYLEVDYHYQLTAASVRMLGKLPQLRQLTAHYKGSRQEIVDAITALKKKKPNLIVTRGYSIYDMLDSSGSWYPGFATEYNDAEKQVFVHCFGWDSSYEAWLNVDDESRITEPFLHTKNYGSLNSSHMTECAKCKQFQLMCKDFIFSGRKISYYLD